MVSGNTLHSWRPAFALAALLNVFTLLVSAQAVPAARRSVPGNILGPLSVFGFATKTDLGFKGQNTAITGGANLRFHPIFHLEPAFEFRATYPIRSGHVAGEQYFLYGPVLRASYHRLHPYANFLVGRGSLNYTDGGYLYGQYIYTKSFSAVHSPGGGFDFDITDNWSLKADAQFQLWHVPILQPDATRAASFSFGVQYHLHKPHFGRKEKIHTDDGTWVTLHQQYPGMNNPPTTPQKP